MQLSKANSHRHTRYDKNCLSCLCGVRFGGVNWIPDNSRLSPTENLKSEHVHRNRPIHTGTLDTTQTGPSYRVWRATWIGHYTDSNSALKRSASCGRRQWYNTVMSRSNELLANSRRKRCTMKPAIIYKLLHGRQCTNFSGLKTPAHGQGTSADIRRFFKNAGDQIVTRADETITW